MRTHRSCNAFHNTRLMTLYLDSLNIVSELNLNLDHPFHNRLLMQIEFFLIWCHFVRLYFFRHNNNRNHQLKDLPYRIQTRKDETDMIHCHV